MSTTKCAGCGTELYGDTEARRWGTDAEIEARLLVIANTCIDEFDSITIGGVEYDQDGFAIHNAARCREMRRRSDCGHSKDCNDSDGNCGWCESQRLEFIP